MLSTKAIQSKLDLKTLITLSVLLYLFIGHSMALANSFTTKSVRIPEHQYTLDPKAGFLICAAENAHAKFVRASDGSYACFQTQSLDDRANYKPGGPVYTLEQFLVEKYGPGTKFLKSSKVASKLKIEAAIPLNSTKPITEKDISQYKEDQDSNVGLIIFIIIGVGSLLYIFLEPMFSANTPTQTLTYTSTNQNRTSTRPRTPETPPPLETELTRTNTPPKPVEISATKATKKTEVEYVKRKVFLD